MHRLEERHRARVHESVELHSLRGYASPSAHRGGEQADRWPRPLCVMTPRDSWTYPNCKALANLYGVGPPIQTGACLVGWLASWSALLLPQQVLEEGRRRGGGADEEKEQEEGEEEGPDQIYLTEPRQDRSGTAAKPSAA
jgi:hypothetical protein